MPQLSHAQIGRMVCSRRPEVVSELVAAYIAPLETDLSAINAYYERFIQLHPLTGDLRENVELRRLFIAAIFHLYQPDVFTSKNVYIRSGLGKTIGEVAGIQKDRLSQLLREVIIRERAYPEFKDKVNEILEEI